MSWRDIIKWIFAKLTSARFIMAVLVIFTLCRSVDRSFDLISSSIKTVDKEVLAFVKEIFMFVLGAFISVVTAITTLYFTRTDRGKQETNGETETK
jgi:hypothetical protein